MSTVKSQIRLDAINEMGSLLDDALESTEKEAYRCEGYERCIRDFEAGIASVLTRVDTDRDNGGFSSIDDPLAVAQVVKQYVMRTQGSLENLKIRNDKIRLLAEGRVAGLRLSVDVAKRMRTAEESRIKAAEKEESPPAKARNRAVGRHPGNPLASRRGEKKRK